MLQDFFAKLPKVGEMVTGKVISVDNGAVRIDVSGLVTGVVRSKELFSESKEYADLKPGDEVTATVVEQENENGEMELSFRIAGYQRVWDNLIKYRDDGITLDGKIVSANKGGLMVKIDAVNGFLPVSQLAPEHYPRVPGGDKNRILEQLQDMIGTSLQVKVLDVDQRQEKLIVSEKAVWEDDQKAVLESYAIGNVVEGEISALTNFGAFMKFGNGLEGLIHISEIVWQRIDHPKDVLKVGQKVKAQIIDLNKSKIYLSMKRLIDDPWKSVKDKFAVGQVVKGDIHKIEPFGLMVKLDDDIHGLAHVSEVSDKPVHDVLELREMFKIGEEREFEIINIEAAEHRLGLRLKGVSASADAPADKKPRVEEKKPRVEEKVESEGVPPTEGGDTPEAALETESAEGVSTT